jgi:hypothetical protein
MKNLTGKEWTLTGLSVPLGFLASVLATWFTTPSPRLDLLDSNSSVAGKTVISVRITNSGDIPLQGLAASFRLQRPSEMSIDPKELSKHILFDGTVLTLKAPSTLEFRPGQSVEMGFISSELNAIVDRGALPAAIVAQAVQVQSVSATPRAGLFGASFPVVPFVAGLSVTTNMLFILMLARLRRKANASEQVSRNPQEHVA